MRIADLRAEAERERAGARLAAQTARERDDARAARDEAARERDAVRAERDSAVQERNRMLAERDTAQTRIEEVARQWELTAALGTRRTLERDTVTLERDRLTRDREAALEERDRAAEERDATAHERDATAQERDAALAELGEWRPHVLSEDVVTSPLDLKLAASDVHESQVWRARMLAISALLVAMVVLLVLVLAK